MKKSSHFQRIVWKEIEKIPYGETRSYKDIAIQIGKPKSYRAVAEGGVMKKPMNEGMKALKKEAPDVAKKMGYNYGGMTKKKSGYMGGGMGKMNDMRKTGMFYGGMAKKKG